MLTKKIELSETASFDTYLLHNSQEYNVNKKRPLVIVCPGGGYIFTSDREAEPIALKFNSIGLHSVVLWYTVYDKVKNTPEHALLELAKTIKYVREQADEWYVDPDNIMVCGFSAGGHLALQMATRWNDPWLGKQLNTSNELLKVNLAISCYPSVFAKAFPEEDTGFAAALVDQPNTANERFFGVKNPTEVDVEKYNIVNYIDENTPPMFIWHTYEDDLVDVSNALVLVTKLREKKIPFELHIFEKGEHGLALCDRTTARKASHHNSHVIRWFDLCVGWLSSYID